MSNEREVFFSGHDCMLKFQLEIADEAKKGNINKNNQGLGIEGWRGIKKSQAIYLYSNGKVPLSGLANFLDKWWKEIDDCMDSKYLLAHMNCGASVVNQIRALQLNFSAMREALKEEGGEAPKAKGVGKKAEKKSLASQLEVKLSPAELAILAERMAKKSQAVVIPEGSTAKLSAEESERIGKLVGGNGTKRGQIASKI